MARTRNAQLAQQQLDRAYRLLDKKKKPEDLSWKDLPQAVQEAFWDDLNTPLVITHWQALCKNGPADTVGNKIFGHWQQYINF